MSERRSRSRHVAWIALGSLLAVACVVVSSTTRRELVDKAAIAGTSVKNPIKAHLRDGSVILFNAGATVDATNVRGTGRRWDAGRSTSTESRGVALDSVVGFEVYQRRVNPFRTLVYSTGLTAAGAVLTAAASVAIFGSCPTIYGDSAGVQALQAESFSYSIAPLLAKRDVDRMSIVPDALGVIRLAVRNEALETHHLDHMEVIEVRHRPEEEALPSPRGGAIAVSDMSIAATVRDRLGRDVSRVVAAFDGSAFTTDNRLLDRAIAGGPTEDQLIITVPRGIGVDSVGLLLKARSSLLTTSVLYEHLMGRQGALALDWMGSDLSSIASLASLATWYGSNFGMRVEVQDGANWRHVIRLMDFGPTAWRQVGVVIPTTPTDDSVRIRLSFAADAFRIDQLAIGQAVRRLEQRVLPIARARDSQGASRTDIVTMLAKADDREVETHPGEEFRVEFDAGPAASGTRTFFFAAQGYYVEWLRPAWMKGPATQEPFSPSRTSMRDLLRSWKGGRDSLEAHFFTRKVPVA